MKGTKNEFIPHILLSLRHGIKMIKFEKDFFFSFGKQNMQIFF